MLSARPWVVIARPFAALFDPKQAARTIFSISIPSTDDSMLDEKGEFRKSFQSQHDRVSTHVKKSINSLEYTHMSSESFSLFAD
jgi:hypothetical protein